MKIRGPRIFLAYEVDEFCPIIMKWVRKVKDIYRKPARGIKDHRRERRTDYFIGINFRGDKLSRSPRGKINFQKFNRYKLSRSRKILAKFSHFHTNFEFFLVLFINISRVTSKVRFRGYKLSRTPKKFAKSRNFIPAEVYTFEVTAPSKKYIFCHNFVLSYGRSKMLKLVYSEICDQSFCEKQKTHEKKTENLILVFAKTGTKSSSNFHIIFHSGNCLVKKWNIFDTQWWRLFLQERFYKIWIRMFSLVRVP